MSSKAIHLPLKPHTIGLLAMFGVQFLAGMILNLFIKLPDAHPGTTGNEYFSRSAHSLIWAFSGSGGWVLAVHSLIALGLVLGCLALLIRSLSIHNKLWSWLSGITFLFTLGAFFNGLSFMNYNQDISSMIMASCWLIAVGALIVGLVKFSKA